MRLGPYELTSSLGAGGMGEVYRARDTRLGRDVALKVLPDAFARDPDRLARFTREAQLLASLNHPHIAAIYGIEEAGETHALVLELVEGPTLADLIAHGPIPLEDAWPMARQIAEALEAAHDQGIVHRDLKPLNIKVRADGSVKVLDFGLAKALEGDTTAAAIGNSPTITSPAATRAGVVMGTAAYMSPEQARGRTADKRTDVWAFGCVLFEMLTGRRAFGGDEIADTLAAVLRGEPDWPALPATVPASVASLLRRCLQKDRSARLRDIADARFRLEEAREESQSPGVVTARNHWGQRFLWIAAMVLAAVVAAVSARRFPSQPVQPDELRLDVTTPATIAPTSLAISPDGRTLVFVGASGGKSLLWLRTLNSTTPRPLAGTENAKYPFWSPDGRSVGFSVNLDLKRVDVESGVVQVIAPDAGMYGGDWLSDDTILATRCPGCPMTRVPAAGGPAVTVTEASTKHIGQRFPEMLPDGRHFLYFATGTEPGIYVGELGTMTTRRILTDSSAVKYLPSGHLLFARQGTLFAQRFDSARQELVGSPAPLVQGVITDGDNAAALSTSAAGPIAFRIGTSSLKRQLIWFDRSGKALEGLPGVDGLSGVAVALSPDGTRVAFNQAGGGTDLWLLDVARGVPTRFTFEPSVETYPVWSRDGTRILYSANPKGPMELFVKPATGSGQATPVNEGRAGLADDWSPDGRYVLYSQINGMFADLWATRLDAGGEPVRLASGAGEGQFSPDGKWVAFVSNESGRLEIFIQPFPGHGDKLQVSVNGGIQPRWRADGQELFFLAPDNRLMAVPISFDPSKPPAIGQPASLFSAQLSGAPQGFTVRSYSVSRDGQRFLMDTPSETTVPVTMILNWTPKP